MPGAQDFVVGQQSSANYARPLIGFQIGDHLAAFPEQYYQARMRAPVIDPQTGQPTSDPQRVSARPFGARLPALRLTRRSRAI